MSRSILLTNDDGIDATGLRVLRDRLSKLGDVTVVAPDADRSGVGRGDSRRYRVADHPLGYAVDGTPADCVHYGVGGLEVDVDLVVAGCNDGPNLGAHRLGRSGTVGAAIEAGFLGLQGLAFSLYDPPTGRRDFDREDYALAGDVAAFLAERALDGELPAFDYLNVNVPADPPEPRLRITEPCRDFRVRIETGEDGLDEVRTWDRFYDPLVPDTDVSMTDPVGSDRRAVFDEEISVSPLRVGAATASLAAFKSYGAMFDGDTR